MNNLKKNYNKKKYEIKKRLQDFDELFLKGTNEDIFAELCFCILTPQSKAKLCWENIVNLKNKNLLFSAAINKISKEICKVRFYNNKSRYIVLARNKLNIVANIVDRTATTLKKFLLSFKDSLKIREWFIQNIKGIGYKEASHFLRNIGLGKNLSILDRHILHNLKEYRVVKNIPKTLTKKKYLQIEQKMLKFCSKIKIPADELDLLFWSKQTGEIFK